MNGYSLWVVAGRRPRRLVGSPDSNSSSDTIMSGKLSRTGRMQSVNHLSLVTRFYLSRQIPMRHDALRRETSPSSRRMTKWMSKTSGGSFRRGTCPPSRRPGTPVRSSKQINDLQVVEAAGKNRRIPNIVRNLRRSCPWKTAGQRAENECRKASNNIGFPLATTVQVPTQQPDVLWKQETATCSHSYQSQRLHTDTIDRMLRDDQAPLTPFSCTAGQTVPSVTLQALFAAQLEEWIQSDMPSQTAENCSRTDKPILASVHETQEQTFQPSLRPAPCVCLHACSATRHTDVPMAVIHPVCLPSALALAAYDGNAGCSDSKCVVTYSNTGTTSTSSNCVSAGTPRHSSAWVSSLAAHISTQQSLQPHSSVFPVLAAVVSPQLIRPGCIPCTSNMASLPVAENDLCTAAQCHGDKQLHLFMSDKAGRCTDRATETAAVSLSFSASSKAVTAASNGGTSRMGRSRVKDCNVPLSTNPPVTSGNGHTPRTTFSNDLASSSPMALYSESNSGIAEGVSAFKCMECNAEFKAIAAYNSHLLGHKTNDTNSGARNKCGVCSRVFTRSWLLKGHMRTHTGERPFHCSFPHCNKAFADKSNLRSHTLIHTTISKSFACPKCARAFSQKRYLHKHMLEVCRII
ncbi:hypothetical protein BaRGS_00009923 [Batillaria attramentaria]|uniref:C2H2-type domain-containing protein n=1 Tax=Batillaria attramentaria TaxID=370345 RepID=A0ABD0LHU0_9CAEN